MKDKIVSFFLSKINIAKFSEIIKKSAVLSYPYKIIAQKLIDYDFPYHLFIETTNACNLKCKMCTRNLSPIKIGMMDLSLAEKIVDEAAKYGPRTFSLHLFGEPLLAPNTIPIVEYIKRKNKKNNILLTTNGVFLSKEVSQKLIDNETDKVVVSVHGANNEQYRSVTGTDDLAKVEENIKNLIALKKESKRKKPKIYLRMVVSKDKKTEMDNFRQKWKNYPVMAEIREPHNFGGKIPNSKENQNFKRYPCYHLWFSPGINWDGQVSICCCDALKEEIIGSIKDEKLSDIWKGEKLKKYREYHLTGQYDKIPLCKDCNVWNSYPDMFFKHQKNEN